MASQVVGTLTQGGGSVWITHAGAKKAAFQNQPIHLGDVIELGGKESAAILQFQDGTNLTLRENTKIMVSRFLLSGEKRETLFQVFKGKVMGFVKTDYDRSTSKAEFKTPTAIVGVRGTRLVLEVSAAITKTYCLEGVLQTWNPLFPTQIFDIPAGKFVEVLRGKIPTALMDIPRRILDEVENYYRIPVSIPALPVVPAVQELKNKIPSAPSVPSIPSIPGF